MERILEYLNVEQLWLGIDLLLAALLGFFIGLERKLRDTEAGIRTHTIVAFGAALMMIISKFAFDAEADSARVAAQIVAGIGFLGAGIIVYRKNVVHGLTTAAGVWATAGIGKAGGGGVHHLQALGQHVLIGNRVVLHGGGVLGGVGAVHAVDVLGQQNHVRVNFHRPEGRTGVRGEVGVAGAAAKDDHPAGLQMPHGLSADVRLSHAPHLDGGLDPDLHALLLQHIGHGQRVHHGGQHAHMVRPDPLHLLGAVLEAAPEVAAAHDDAHLHAQIHALFDCVADAAHHIEVVAPALVAGERFAADFQ